MLERMWRNRNPLALLVGMQMVQPLWKTVWRFLKKLKIDLPYDPAITLLGIYPRDTGVLMLRGTCTPMFIGALSTIAKLWQESKCPSTDEWIKKLWFIYTMEYLFEELLIGEHHSFFIRDLADHCPHRDRKSTRLNSSHSAKSRMPSSA